MAAATDNKRPDPEHWRYEEMTTDQRKRLRGRNLAVLALLVAWCALIYVVAMVRMGGG